MKNLYLIAGIIFIMFFSCKNPNLDDSTSIPKDYVEHVVELENNLGLLSISLPPEFDTAYSYTYRDDNACAATEIFRFANKKYSTICIQGTFWHGPLPDSLYELSIMQSKHPDLCEDPTERIEIEKLLATYIDFFSSNYPDIKMSIREIRTINDRDFIVIGSQYTDTLYYGASEERIEKRTELFLYTTVNGYSLSLVFLCQDGNCVDFINRVEKSLPSIKIQ